MSYIGNIPSTQAFTPAIDYFSGNGSTTAFTLSRPVASVAQVQAVISNVPQSPSDAFTVNGNTITFTSAPPSGTNNIYVQYTSPITQIVTPSDGSVGTSTLANNSVTPAKMSAGAPTWSQSGGVTLPRIDSSAEGGQINFNRASDDTSTWSIDSYGSSATPALRFIDGATLRAQFDSSGNFQFNSGYGSAATAYGCRAWVNFNGTTSPGTIRASGNVASVTKNGTGDYTINFTNALSDANYSALGTSGQGGTFVVLNANDTTANSTTAVRFYSRAASTATFTDLSLISIAVFR